ncbi:FecR domain-containing protein [Xanthomonas sp. WHRI 10064A]|uniref:FecR family protein n=1 Tax=unclassified Xanthomonas TaxID=2643310 RepID=UPI002B23664D|nr:MULTISPECIES: FecR domain-containing protein [unclassified Xanthomonas]MEA9585923.1 FecR domain-containing protein [Xanthomonas sp. WHRI 10064B]MEA9614350.1 FecR domain-containing protein [Xanthomonas sp. WHRI 10064A]
MDSRQIEQIAAQWLARREGDRWDATSQVELDAWLAQSTAHRVAFLRLDAAWREAERLKAIAAGLPKWGPPARGRFTGSAIAPAAHDTLVQVDPSSHHAMRQKRRWKLPLAAALVFGLAIASTMFLDDTQPAQTKAGHAYQSAPGTLRALALADGSRSTLGSDTRISVDLSHRERHIALQRGEAFFEVAKDKSRPFVVQVGTRRVVAVGTQFSVRRDADELWVIVTEGTVRLDTDPKDGRPQSPVLIAAGGIAVAGPHGVLVRSSTIAEAQQQVDWRSGYLSFTNAPLRDAVAEFNRFNTRPLVLADPQLGELRIGGRFSWRNTDGFARLLERSYPIRTESRAEQVILHAR